MKAKVKTTGEVIEVSRIENIITKRGVERQYVDNKRSWCTYVQSELEFIKEELHKNIDWEQRRYEIAKDMMTSAEQHNQIRIINVRVERLQDISDEDCLKEGIIKGQCGSADTHFMDAYYVPNDIQPYCTPQDAYEILIDKVSGKDTWERNPYVFVYDFELVK